jgi:hypothetical protein
MVARAIESRFEALRSGALPDLVGREPERDLLTWLWPEAKRARGHAVLISGEPGMRDARLAYDDNVQLRATDLRELLNC